MGDSVERYKLFARQSDKVTVEFYDPTLNPAQARLHGVRFPGTAVMTSEDRRSVVNGDSEADIANGVLRIAQGVTRHIPAQPLKLFVAGLATAECPLVIFATIGRAIFTFLRTRPGQAIMIERRVGPGTQQAKRKTAFHFQSVSYTHLTLPTKA